VEEDFIVIQPSKERDPDGSKLRDALAAHLALERARAHREFLVYVLGAASVPVWLSATWPRWLPDGFRSPALAAWAICLAGLAIVVVSEWRWYRKRAALLVALGPPSGVHPG
jgi:hypothetical protein